MGDIAVFVNDAIAELTKRKSVLDDQSKRIREYIEHLLAENEIPFCAVTARTKSSNSLKEKIYRKNYFSKYKHSKDLVDDLSDGIGVRISCLLSEEEENICEFLFNQFNNQKDMFGKVFFFNDDMTIGLCKNKQPEKQKNGQPIYRIDGVIIQEKELIRFELQIKSLVHFLWGEIEHSLFYKKYDYIISNSYYSQLMNSINRDLENIDNQIYMLKMHMDNKDNNQVKSVREIAAYVLSNRFQSELCKEIGCEIDLREVYDLYVDLVFLMESNPEKCLATLHKFVQNVSEGDNIADCYHIVTTGKIDYEMVAPACKKLAEMIAEKIDSSDIFWTSFVTVYATMKRLNDFSRIINDLSIDLRNLVLSISIDIDMIEEESISDSLSLIVNDELIESACKVGKIGFFNISNNLVRVDEEMKKIGIEIQNAIMKLKMNKETVYEMNIDVIRAFLFVHIMWASGEKISSTIATGIVKQFIDRNDLSLKPNEKVREWLTQGINDVDLLVELAEENDKEVSE